MADLGLTAVGPGLAAVLKAVSGLLVAGLAAAFGFGLVTAAIAFAAGVDLSKLLLAAVTLTTADRPAAAVAVSSEVEVADSLSGNKTGGGDETCSDWRAATAPVTSTVLSGSGSGCLPLLVLSNVVGKAR